jgi:hypothetical protein
MAKCTCVYRKGRGRERQEFSPERKGGSTSPFGESFPCGLTNRQAGDIFNRLILLELRIVKEFVV